MTGRSRRRSDAKANLARARAAVDDYLTTISESRLLNSPLPGLQPLRKELLTTALKYYEDFVSQNQDDTDLQADLAAATLRVGEITDQIGSKEDALKAFQTASEHVQVARRSGRLALEPVLPGRPRSLPRQDGDDPVRSRASRTSR